MPPPTPTQKKQNNMDTSQQVIVLRKAQSKAEKRDYLPQKIRKTQVCQERLGNIHIYMHTYASTKILCVFEICCKYGLDKMGICLTCLKPIQGPPVLSCNLHGALQHIKIFLQLNIVIIIV